MRHMDILQTSSRRQRDTRRTSPSSPLCRLPDGPAAYYRRLSPIPTASLCGSSAGRHRSVLLTYEGRPLPVPSVSEPETSQGRPPIGKLVYYAPEGRLRDVRVPRTPRRRPPRFRDASCHRDKCAQIIPMLTLAICGSVPATSYCKHCDPNLYYPTSTSCNLHYTPYPISNFRPTCLSSLPL